MPRTISPGPAGLKFWRAPGPQADNTDDPSNLPAGATHWFNPWRAPQPVQDWVRGVSPLSMPVGTLFAADAGSYALTGAAAVLVVPDVLNLPAGNVSWFNPWGRPHPINLRTTTGRALLAAPFTLTAAGGSYALSGTANLFGFGQGALGGTYSLTGSAAALALRHTAGTGSYTLTGSAAALALGHAAASGSYTVTGSAAALKLGHVAGAGSYALTGSAAALALGQVTGAGSYTLTGANASFILPAGVVAASGSYILTGSDATFVIPGVVSYLPAGMSGGYVPWGRPFPVTLLTRTGRPLSEAAAAVTLTAAGGAYTITGSAAALTVASPPDTANLPAGATSWFNPWRRPHPVNLRSISGRPLFTSTPTVLTAAGGSYTITGSDANLVQAGSITLTCGAGSYLITGAAAGLIGTVTPPVEVTPPSPGGAGVRVGPYKRLKLKKKRKRDECEELLEYLANLPPLTEIERPPELPPLPSTASLLDCIPPISRPQVRAAINKIPIRDDDDDEDAIALLLEFL